MISNKSDGGIVAFKQIVALPSDLNIVRGIVATTISGNYPLYYPSDVVQFFLDHHAPERILTDIETGGVSLFEANSVIVGTGTIRENEIKRVFVLPEHQGRGYGSLIMKQLEDMAFRRYPIVRLDASLPAFGMYLSRGYKLRAWRKIVMSSGQVLCYHEMEKEMQRHTP
jgi:GNAT superfamily N-acetyltransferase